MLSATLSALMLGTGIGILTGFFGAGGGFILTPALHLFLGLGMPLAVGTGAAQISVTALITLKQRLNRQWLGARVALCCAIGIFPGSWCGVRLIRHMGGIWEQSLVDRLLLGVFALLLFGIGVGMLRDHSGQQSTEPKAPGRLNCLRIPPLGSFRTIPAGKFSIPVLVILGGAMGLLSGLLGIGGGVVMLPILIYLVGQPGRFATLTTTMIVFLSSFFSTFFHALDGNIDWRLLLPLCLGGSCGSFLGVRLQKNCPEMKLRKYFTVVVALAWLLVMWKLA